MPPTARNVLLTRLRHLARDSEGDFSAVDASPEGAFATDPEALGAAEAEVVEHGGGLRAFRVAVGGGSGFTAFLDGIQRSAVRLYCGPVPLVYAYAAAVVRTRRDRRMTTHLLDCAEREAVFFPFRLVDPSRVSALGVAEAEMQDTSPASPEEPLPLFPPQLYALATLRINRWREALEAELAVRWVGGANGGAAGFLLVDGPLAVAPALAASTRAVGVIKSHRTRFFDGDDARVLLGLEAGERTSVFRPRSWRDTPVYSWYLRLRPPAGKGALWGLVRVEAAAAEGTLRRADEISAWLLAETAPLALPDARWDRMIYPIRDCEEYLRSRAPRL
jgi:hypothetical protein